MKTFNQESWNNGYISGKFEMWTNGYCDCYDMVLSLKDDLDIKEIKEHLMNHPDMSYFWEDDSWKEDDESQQQELIGVLNDFDFNV